MAITRADLEIRKGFFSGKASNGAVVVCTVLLGLIAFSFCLIAETARTQVLWTPMTIPNLLDSDDFTEMKCTYSRSGSAALACAVGALAAMVLSLALTLSKRQSDDLMQPLSIWNSNSTSTSALRWQAAIFLVTSWTSFAVSSALLLIGIILEAGIVFESSRRREPKDQCLVVSQGLFTGAGIFALASTSAMSAFYIAALHAVKLEQRAIAAVNQEIAGVDTRAEGNTTHETDPPPLPSSSIPDSKEFRVSM